MIKLSETCLQTVIEASKKRKDNLDNHNDKEVIAHKACLLEYMSSNRISRQLKHESNSKQQELVPTKGTRRYILNLIPNILTGGERIKACFVVQQIEKNKKKSVKEVLLEINYFFFLFLDRHFRTQKHGLIDIHIPTH